MDILKRIIFLLVLIAFDSAANADADTSRIRLHLRAITKTTGFRTHKDTALLNKTAEYIRIIFSLHSDSHSVQTYKAGGMEYKNVICSFGTENKRRIIIGAHYDVCGLQEGADDNASGVTGLLELARMLKGQKLKFRVDLVAYSLEEPPYFRSELMGSYIHAKSLKDNKTDVYGMIALEMIGYFKDEKGSQTYPVNALSLIYGKKGNYITLVKKIRAGKFTRKFCKKYKLANTIKTKKFAAPPSLPGIDFSDHLNYWKFGYSALMITDTAFFRNKNYHEETDTMETLDLNRMAKVIDGVLDGLVNMK